MKKNFYKSPFYALTYLLFLAVFLLPNPSFGEEFTKLWGWSNSDSLTSIKETSDGNYIAIGTTRKNYDTSNSDSYLAKINPQGIKIWELVFGTVNGDYSYEVKQAADGGYVTLSRTIIGAYNYILLAKIDANGTLLWSQLLGTGTNTATAMDIAQNGDVLLTGSNGIYVYLARTNSSGYILWEKTFTRADNRGGDSGNSVKETSNGDIIIAGSFYSTTAGSSAYIMRTNSVGTKIWDKLFQVGHLRSIYQLADGSFVACGITTSIGYGNWDAYLLKINSVGTKVWEKTFGKQFNDYGYQAIPTYDGGIAVIGESGAGVTPTGAGAYLVKTNSLGVEQWSRSFGTGGGSNGSSLAETSDGGFMVAGFCNSFYTTVNTQFMITKVDDLLPTM